MSGNLIVGFSTAASAPGAVPAAAAAPGPSADAETGFSGLLGALLGSGNAPFGTTMPVPASAPLSPELRVAVAGSPLPPMVTPPAAQESEPVAAEDVPAAAETLLLDVAQALTALDAALENGRPVDPLLRERLDEALAALAAYLEIPVPTTSALTTTALAGVMNDAAVALDAPDMPLPAAPGASLPGRLAADGGASPPAVPPLVKQLVEKLQSIGGSLKVAEPELAERLQAVAERLLSGRITPQQLAALGLDAELPQAEGEIGKVLDLLLRPAPPPKPAAPPPVFSAASLALPPEVAAPRSEKPVLATPVKDAPAPAAPDRHTAEPRLAERPAERPTAGEATPTPRTPAAGPAAPAASEAETLPAGTAAAGTAVTAAAATVTKTVHAAYQSPPQQINVPQVAFEVARQFQAGNSRFQIRLDPPELGRIDVRMDMDRDGNVVARMTVERSETLDLMQRDQRALERALAQAGLDSARTSLEFSLRQQGSGREQREGHGHPVFSDAMGGGTSEPEAPPAPTTYHRGLASPSGVNLFV